MGQSLEASVVVVLCIVIIFGMLRHVPALSLKIRAAGLEVRYCSELSAFSDALYEHKSLQKGGILSERSPVYLSSNGMQLLELFRLKDDLLKIEKSKERPAPKLTLPWMEDREENPYSPYLPGSLDDSKPEYSPGR